MNTPQMPFANPSVFFNKYKYWHGAELTTLIPIKSAKGIKINVEIGSVDGFITNQQENNENENQYIKKKIRWLVAPDGTKNNTNDETQATGGLDLFFATMCTKNLNGCYVFYAGRRWRLHDMKPSLVHHYEYVGTENGSKKI